MMKRVLKIDNDRLRESARILSDQLDYRDEAYRTSVLLLKLIRIDISKLRVKYGNLKKTVIRYSKENKRLKSEVRLLESKVDVLSKFIDEEFEL